MRLGVFGGTFDPIHYGHLLLAECCREQAQLDQVWFVPNARSPHKLDRTPAAAAMRAEMIELAIAGNDQLAVCRREIDRGGVSFTVDTLAELRDEDPSRQFFLLLGADSLADFPKWREPARICSLARLVVVRRAGCGPPNVSDLAGVVGADELEAIRGSQVEMPLLDLSASDLRHRSAAGKSLRFRTPRAVEEYIRSHRLYA